MVLEARYIYTYIGWERGQCNDWHESNHDSDLESLDQLSPLLLTTPTIADITFQLFSRT